MDNVISITKKNRKKRDTEEFLDIKNALADALKREYPNETSDFYPIQGAIAMLLSEQAISFEMSSGKGNGQHLLDSAFEIAQQLYEERLQE